MLWHIITQEHGLDKPPALPHRCQHSCLWCYLFWEVPF